MSQQFTLADGMVLCLRPLTDEHISCLYESAIFSRDKLAKWMPWCHKDYSISDTETWVRETNSASNEHTFIIMDEDEELCLGTCGLNAINERHRFANLGYWVRASHLGRGIAPAATLQLASFAFSELGLTRVEIVAALGNYASQRVAQKVGARREGVIRNGLVYDDNALDAVMYSLIPEDLSQD